MIRRTEEWGSRYRDIIAPEVLASSQAAVIGCGAIGRQVATQAAAMGFGTLALIDPDTISAVNVGTQGWAPRDIGKGKVEVLSREIKRKYGKAIRVYSLKGLGQDTWPVVMVETVFVCPDSMAARRAIWGAHKDDEWVLWVDGRMAAEACTVFSVRRHRREDGRDDRAMYETTLSDEGVFEAPCTARATIYCANVAAGMMLNEYACWHRDFGTRPLGTLLSLVPANAWALDEKDWRGARDETGEGLLRACLVEHARHATSPDRGRLVAEADEAIAREVELHRQAIREGGVQ